MTVSTVVERPLVGRARELRRIETLVRGVENGPCFLVVRGEPGIGKTALWRNGIERHRAAGHRVLVARPAEEELPGGMTGLLDLFEHIETVPGTLDADRDPFGRGRGVLGTLRDLTRESPVVLAIDDVQWLDPVSARSLRYAMRRLDTEPVAVLATERTQSVDHGAGGRFEGTRMLPPERLDEIVVGPLSLDAIRQVVRTVVETISRPALSRIHELSGGNPMLAIELARSAELLGDPLGAAIPATLSSAVSRRVADAPQDVRSVLAVAAALGPSSAATLARAWGGDSVVPIQAAIARGLLVVGGDLVLRFSHPLLASAALAELDPLDRQALHARLVEVVDDPDQRARHLALSCAEPDAAVAEELGQAAMRASRRGASALAAELADHCLRVTPPADLALRARRWLVAILHRATAGEKTRALADLDELIGLLPSGPMRAEAIGLRVAIDFGSGDRYLEQALAEADDDELLRGRILELCGWVAVILRGEPREGLELAELALAIAHRRDDPGLEMIAASSVAIAGLLVGTPRPDLMERALELADSHTGPRLGRWPPAIEGRLCLWGGRLEQARRHFEDLHAVFLQSGMEFQRPFRLLDLADLEVACGHLALASELADDGIEAADDAGNAQAAAWLSYPAAIAWTHLGEADRAGAAVARLRSLGTDRGGATRLLMARHVVGLLALVGDQPGAALAELLPAVEELRRKGVRLPSPIPVLPDAIEAAAACGDASMCAQLSAELDSQAAAVQQPWVDAAALRGQGLVALTEGRHAAGELLGAAAAAFSEFGCRMEGARSLLLQGRGLRRLGRRNASAEVLEQARERFAAMGAAPWESRAAAELDRVAPGREQAVLTPTESRIAELIAAGDRNREIAGKLFVSVATVEAHLTRIYRKLHVRSRTELARLIQ